MNKKTRYFWIGALFALLFLIGFLYPTRTLVRLGLEDPWVNQEVCRTTPCCEKISQWEQKTCLFQSTFNEEIEQFGFFGFVKKSFTLSFQTLLGILGIIDW